MLVIIRLLNTQNNVIVSGCVHTKYTVSAENGNVTFFHELDNTRSDNDTEYDFLIQTTVVRVYHKNNASRKVSRLAVAVNKIHGMHSHQCCRLRTESRVS